MVKNKGNVDMWICPSRNEKADTKLYPKNIKLYHGTDKKNLKSILKQGLKRRIGDSTYIYTSPKKEIAKKYGNTVLEIDGKGLDLRIWETDKENQVMIMGDVEPKRIKNRANPQSPYLSNNTEFKI